MTKFSAALLYLMSAAMVLPAMVLPAMAGAPALSPTGEKLLAITQEMDNALAPGDTRVWDHYTDPALTYVSEDNIVMDKATYLANLKPLPKGFSGVIRVVDFRERDFADFAVCTYIQAETETIEGHTIQESFRETDTWHMTPQGWRLVGAQVLPVLKEPPAILLSSAQLDGYAGTYVFSPQSKQTVQRDGDHLVALREGRPTQILRAEAVDVFFTPGALRTRRIFLHAPDGTVTGFASRREGTDLLWEKVPAGAVH